MLGAIIGDIVGSRFEHNNIKTKNFKLLTDQCRPTDDTIMTLAIAKAILECNENYSNLDRMAEEWMQYFGRKYSNAGYGNSFFNWLYMDFPKPYNSYGNGSAMRVSACAYAAHSLSEAKDFSKSVTKISHNHPEGIKGAEAAVVAVYMALHGSSISQIRDRINDNYYPMNFTIDGIRDSYTFDVTCQGSVPQAIMAFLESSDFEDAIRNAVSIGGDSDTIAAITGSIAEAYYGIPEKISNQIFAFLDKDMIIILNEFEEKYRSVQN